MQDRGDAREFPQHIFPELVLLATGGVLNKGFFRRRAALTHPPSSAPRRRFLAATCTPSVSYGLVGSVPACGACSARTSSGSAVTGPTPKLPPPAYGAPFGALEPLLRCDARAPRAMRGVGVVGQRPRALGPHVDARGWILLLDSHVSPGGPKPELAPSAPSVPGMVHVGRRGHGGDARTRSDRASRPVGGFCSCARSGPRHSEQPPSALGPTARRRVRSSGKCSRAACWPRRRPSRSSQRAAAGASGATRAAAGGWCASTAGARTT